MILKDFKCAACEYIFESLVHIDDTTCICECGKKADIAYLRAPSVHGCDSFNSHFDYQVGEFFASKEEKTKFLKKHNREQISGHDSPRKTNGSSIICSKQQARKLQMPNKEKASVAQKEKHGSNDSRSG